VDRKQRHGQAQKNGIECDMTRMGNGGVLMDDADIAEERARLALEEAA